MGLASGLLASDLGSPHGVTTNAKYVHHLWNITWLFAVPIAAIVAGLILWCVIRYRRKPGERHSRPRSSSTTSPSKRPTPSSRS